MILMTERSSHPLPLTELEHGGMVVLCDDRGRGGEGDLLIAAEHADRAAVNYMAKEGRGLIYLILTADRVETLGLEPIPTRSDTALAEASMVSIEAREGVTTGISAADRARTIAVATAPASGPDDLVQPGHVLPLCARTDLPEQRRSWIEASIELVAAAGLEPAAVVCQILRADGAAARGKDLESFARDRGLALCRTSEAIALGRD